MKMKRFRNRLLSALVAGGTFLGLGGLSAHAQDFNSDYAEARNALVKAMTGVDPLTQSTITEPPYGAQGWMPIGADSLVRFAGTFYLNTFNNDGDKYTKDAENSYIKQTDVSMSLYTHTHQPFATTVQQRRDHGRRTEPVVVYFVAENAKSGNEWRVVVGHIYVQSMIKNPECGNVGHHSAAEWDNIYSDHYLIHHTRPQGDMVQGDFSNNVKRNEAFDAMISASACDLDGDGYDEILVFYANKVDIFDGKTFEYKKCVDLNAIDDTFMYQYYSNNLSYGYNHTKNGFVPNTWTSVVSDVDGDGVDDVIALCHSGFYWDHIKAIDPEKDEEVISETGKVRSIFIPGGKGLETTPVVNTIGDTPKLMWDAQDPSTNNSTVNVYRYKRFPRWNNTKYNNHDGIINHDMYHYYHVTLSADVVYPNGMFNSTQPVLAVAWKYLWSDSPTRTDSNKEYTDEEFRTGMHEWYQLTTYNLTDNKTAFTQQSQSAPTCAAKVDIYDLLKKADAWVEAYELIQYGSVKDYLHYSQVYNNTVNAHASLRRPAFKTWYAGGRTMPPHLFFEGINMYYNPGVSGNINKYTISSVNALGYNSGWPSKSEDAIGRICGPIYTYYDHIDEDGALDDRESIVVPVATRKTTDADPERYQDNEYRIVTGRFSKYNASNLSQTEVTSSSNTIGTGPTGQNAIFYSVPFVANTAKVELQGSYYTASNPIVKAVLAIPPYNKDDVVDESKVSVAFSRSSGEGTEQGHSTSTTLGGGFSMELSLFKALKLGYSYSYEQSWEKSWAKSFSMTSTTEYSSQTLNNLVVFNYIPVDCFEYKVVDSPGNPALKGKSFTFRRALNMLNGEAHMPEVCWTVEDYNKWMTGAGLPHIDKNLFPHTIGNVNSYRRIPKFISKENIISYFPLKKDGFYAVHDGGAAGSSLITHSLSISNGESGTTGESFSHTSQINFGLGGELSDVGFAGGINGKYGSSESWKTTTTLTSSMSVKGTIPAVKDISTDSYDFYQVWYEYSDAESGQDFLVCDWAVGQNNKMPLYSDLKCVNQATYDKYGRTFYKVKLEWCANSNNPIGKCVLEYKIDGITPSRSYTGKGGCTLPAEEGEQWQAIEQSYDMETNEWTSALFTSQNNAAFGSWEFTDYFNLTTEQQKQIKAKAGLGEDVYIRYRVKVYDVNDQLVGTSDEMSSVLIQHSEQLKTSRTMLVDITQLPYGTTAEGQWTKVEHLRNAENPTVLYGNNVNNDNFANLTGYQFLLLHGKPSQTYQVFINGDDAVEVGLDENGDAAFSLFAYPSEVHLRGIRVADGETLADDAAAYVQKLLGAEEGLVLSGDGQIPEECRNYTLYDAKDVMNYQNFSLQNPNALVLDAYGDGVPANINKVYRSNEVEQGFTAERLSIADGYNFCYDYSVLCPAITFTRSGISNADQYASVVLPFAVDNAKGTYQYMDCDGENLYFKSAEGTIPAYTPLLVNVATLNEITLSGENLQALKPNGTFNLTTAPSSTHEMMFGFVTKRQEDVSVTDNNEVNAYNIYGYSIKSHQFVRATNTLTINPFRAFFLLPKSVQAPANDLTEPATAPSALKIVIDGKVIGENTGVEDLTTTTPQGDGITYNLLGLPVGPDYRGIAIRNGKKVIIK